MSDRSAQAQQDIIHLLLNFNISARGIFQEKKSMFHVFFFFFFFFFLFCFSVTKNTPIQIYLKCYHYTIKKIM